MPSLRHIMLFLSATQTRHLFELMVATQNQWLLSEAKLVHIVRAFRRSFIRMLRAASMAMAGKRLELAKPSA